jgi:DNA-binding response OmpR family regulator
VPELPLILLVEDEYLLMADVEEALTGAGFAVHAVATGEEALTLFINERTYKALITDIHLRGRLNGWDVARRIREKEPSFPVVYVTGAAAEEWPAQGVPNSILVAKPCAPAQLITAVSNLLNIGTPPTS